MNRPVAVLCVLVAACSSAPSADVETTVAGEVTTTAVHEMPTTTDPATGSTTTPAAATDSAPPGEPIGVSETVTIVIVDP